MTTSENDIPEIEIRDPGEEEESPGTSRGLFVPLVVVPAMIVMLGVLIVTLVGLVSGSESTPRDNIDVLLTGGANERQQAAFSLVRQMLEYQRAVAEDREPLWQVDEQLLGQLRQARASVRDPERPEDVWEPFVLSSILAQFGDPDGVVQLAEATRLSDALDPEFLIRTNAIFILGSIGRDLAGASRKVATQALIEFVEGEDEGMTWLAAGALQNLPSPETTAALVGLLERRRLDIRLQAALSLAENGDDAGAEVLASLVEEGPYLAEREENPTRWASQTISTSRSKVLLALGALDRLPAEVELRRLADEDPDPNIQSVARGLLQASPDAEVDE